MKGLVAIEVCSEEPDGRFALTAVGKWLESETPGSVRGLAILTGEEYAPAWEGLLHSVRTGETAFNHVFGMSQWQHREKHPELNDHFNAAIGQATDWITGAILAAYDFSSFRTLLDVGGGRGALLAGVLETHSALRGVLFDQPHVVGDAQKHLKSAGVLDRCDIVGGDFFERVPEGADAHILKSIVHDWNDEKSLVLLKNCHRALKEGGALLIVERILPARVDQAPDAVLADLQMLAVTGGLERTEDEYRDLMSAADFRMTKAIPTRCGLAIIEGRRN
jgi:SAM-dependent methyltransferase